MSVLKARESVWGGGGVEAGRKTRERSDALELFDAALNLGLDVLLGLNFLEEEGARDDRDEQQAESDLAQRRLGTAAPCPQHLCQNHSYPCFLVLPLSRYSERRAAVQGDSARVNRPLVAALLRSLAERQLARPDEFPEKNKRGTSVAPPPSFSR